ncbi:hypothetical protein F4778DRAFT_439788 [Xylariomycetidae sp. FL2044]|nr:hypothetical protein F4778DRAFT_439788 [Xylariomycetidae sp. FL2044]
MWLEAINGLWIFAAIATCVGYVLQETFKSLRERWVRRRKTKTVHLTRQWSPLNVLLRLVAAGTLITVLFQVASIVRRPSMVRGRGGGGGESARRQDAEEAAVDISADPKMGFGAIRMISSVGRPERAEIAVLQARRADISLDLLPVAASSPGAGGRSARSVSGAGKGSWESHANIWSEMLYAGQSAVLVLEDDSEWDVNLRHIMETLRRQFFRLLRDQQRGVVYELSVDPWYSEHWDVLSLGHCYDGADNHLNNRLYHDPYSPDGQAYFGKQLSRQRVVRKSGGLVCTAAYAVTASGAEKLLMRSALERDQPIDLMMEQMVEEEVLVAYSVTPSPFAQWDARQQRSEDGDTDESSVVIDEKAELRTVRTRPGQIARRQKTTGGRDNLKGGVSEIRAAKLDGRQEPVTSGG